MKPYRNALRSKRLIKEAYIDLLEEKSDGRMTIQEVVNRADVSRNTFYAHFADLRAVEEEIENQTLEELSAYIDEAIRQNLLNHPYAFLIKLQEFYLKDPRRHKILLQDEHARTFQDKLIRILMDKTRDSLESEQIEDSEGFMLFMDLMAKGLCRQLCEALCRDDASEYEKAARNASRIFEQCIPMYR